jgi:broad specificity phosphatase PhoE
MKIRSQTTIYFIRHGQTPSNKAGKKQGSLLDDYLNTQGILQAEKMSHLMQFLDLDLLFTSYLHRAEETARIIYKNLGTDISILHDFRLHERDFGKLTGKTEAELEQIVPNWKETDYMQMYDYRPFGGESVADVRLRVFGAILDIIQNYNHRNIGIITHDGVIRLMLFHFEEITRLYHGQEKTSQDIDNTDIYEWEINESRIGNLKSLLK